MILKPRRRSERGFTLLELLVVLAILGLLAAIVAPQVLRYLGGARGKTAEVQLRNLAEAVELYQFDVGRYPSPEEGLPALVTQPAAAPGWNGPYMARPDALNDPWGRPYLYRVPGRAGAFDVYSLGSDNAAGGDGEARDIYS